MNNGIKKNGLGQRASTRISNIVAYTLLIAIAVVWLFPFVGIFIESFRVESTGQKNYMIPQQWGFDNYMYLLGNVDNNGFTRWFLNTALVGVISAVIQTGFILSMSYTLSRLRFKGRKGRSR